MVVIIKAVLSGMVTDVLESVVSEFVVDFIGVVVGVVVFVVAVVVVSSSRRCLMLNLTWAAVAILSVRFPPETLEVVVVIQDDLDGIADLLALTQGGSLCRQVAVVRCDQVSNVTCHWLCKTLC